MPTHKHTHSLTQNRKAELATAYNELGKELSSSKIRVVGNYTLGRVIGEGMKSSLLEYYFRVLLINQVHTERSGLAPIV